jgi:hypothetical protein
MAGGSLLTEFLTFDKLTTQASISEGGFVNDGYTLRKYFPLRLRDTGQLDYVSAGKSIQFNIQLSAQDTFQEYSSGATGTPTNTNHMEQGLTPWTMARDNKVYERAEILLNERANSGSSRESRAKAWGSVSEAKTSSLNTSMAQGITRQFWAVPNKDLMEGVSGLGPKKPFSALAAVNEDGDGLFGKTHLPAATEWTTKQGLDPTTAAFGANYKPQTATYANFTSGSATNIFGGMNAMMKKLTWERPTKFSEYWENPTLNKQAWITTQTAHTNIQNLLAAGQSLYAVGAQDPSYPDPQHYGIPITWDDSFEAGSYYKDTGGTGLAPYLTADIIGSRMLALNGNYIHWVIHPEVDFEVADAAADKVNRPDVFVVWVSIWHQFVWTSMRHQGIIYPSADIVPAA